MRDRARALMEEKDSEIAALRVRFCQTEPSDAVSRSKTDPTSAA